MGLEQSSPMWVYRKAMSQPLSYRELSQPVVEPVTLAQAKAQLRRDVSFTDDDALITSLIVSARRHCERLMNRAIFNRNMQMTLDYFPFPNFGSTINSNDKFPLFSRYWSEMAIRLPMPSLASSSNIAITYLDLTSSVQTLDPSTFTADINSEPARIVPIPFVYWPWSQNYIPGNITVTWTAGSYGDGVDVNTCPQEICQAMLMLISYWYNHTDSAESNPPKAIEFSVDALLAPYKFETNQWN